MRGSLTGVLARVDRLAARMRPSAEDLEAKLKTMSYEDLEALMVRTLERAVGPADGFGTADAFVDAVCAATHEGRDQQSGTQDVARAHWRRLRWLQAHTAHGSVAFVPHRCVQPRPGFPWGPGIIASCSCGDTLKLFRALIPAEFKLAS
jgi:hypothetical protein